MSRIRLGRAGFRYLSALRQVLDRRVRRGEHTKGGTPRAGARYLYLVELPVVTPSRHGTGKMGGPTSLTCRQLSKTTENGRPRGLVDSPAWLRGPTGQVATQGPGL